MKKMLVLCTITSLSGSLWAVTNNNGVTLSSSQSDQAGYSLGYLLGKNNAEALQGINLDAFIQGLSTAAKGKQPVLSEQDMAKVLDRYKKQSEAKELNALQHVAEKNSREGEQFLADNAQKTGVMTTSTGLQYSTITTGTGKSPSKDSTVTINYEGRLLDGTVFDSSIARQQPVTLKISEVITGLAQGLSTMKEGGKSRFFIPAKLGYGAIGAGDAIGPDSTLIFDVDLIKVAD
ncbi:FKBP-type peptidyl-prolyl cis-trans isomerase [Acinetobacter rathckeae]|uniref:FKBP-type peptidyl-prolyl cis-trans isomerase n=1 Tax=Acinetobacter rathckeae TaxID=2605272 RepID=UPI0018A30591|nr:FKBP-type peptidyl-prolyl cis-trans isomerase [Acinetobacter rathckeae]MBF7696285.1 FKBP-type peptidyl-prolyl cis-trans isomerase [Acinetobacter rathckeae]